MEKSKKKKGLSRLFEIAGQRKGLLILAGLLSAGSAVCTGNARRQDIRAKRPFVPSVQCRDSGIQDIRLEML